MRARRVFAIGGASVPVRRCLSLFKTFDNFSTCATVFNGVQRYATAFGSSLPFVPVRVSILLVRDVWVEHFKEQIAPRTTHLVAARQLLII